MANKADTCRQSVGPRLERDERDHGSEHTATQSVFIGTHIVSVQAKVDRLKGRPQKTASGLDALLPILDKAFKGEL